MLKTNRNSVITKVKVFIIVAACAAQINSILIAANECPYQPADCVGAGDFCTGQGYRCVALHPGKGAKNNCPLPSTGVWGYGPEQCGRKYQRPATFDPAAAKAAGSDCYNANGNCGGKADTTCG